MLRFILLFAISFNCFAMDGEISVGETHFAHPPDGLWYQQPFPHDIQLNSPSIALGISDYVSDGIRYHAGYRYLGRVTSNAQAVASDALYAKYGASAGNHIAMATWIGQGNVNMLYATLAPEYRVGDWTFAVEGGFTAYRSTWDEQVVNYQTTSNGPYQTSTLRHRPIIETGRTYGASIKYKQIEVVYSLFDITTTGDGYPSAYVGMAQNISVRYRF